MNVKYGNYLSNFKEDLWQFCESQHVFTGIPENQIKNVVNVVDMIVSNYQSQILQNDNKQALYTILVKEISKQVESFKVITNEELRNMKKDSFQQSYENKQREFEEYMKVDQPKPIEFNDSMNDEPLTNEGIEALIKMQIQEREKLVQTQQNQFNNIAPTDTEITQQTSQKGQSPKFTSAITPPQLKTLEQTNDVIADKTLYSFPYNTPNKINNNETSNLNTKNNHYEDISHKSEKYFETINKNINKIIETQKLQNQILNNLISSQISILQKLK